MAAEENVKGGVKVDAVFGDSPLRGQSVRSQAQAPFGLLIVGDFGGRGDGKSVDVTAADLADLGAMLEAKVNLALPNRLGTTPPMLHASVPIRSLRDLDPKTLETRVPQIVKARSALAEVQRGGSPGEIAGDPQFDRLLAALAAHAPGVATTAALPSVAPAAADEDASLDRLLGMVEVPGQAPESTLAKAAVSAFVASIAKPERSQPATAAASEAAQLLLEQTRDLLAHPAWLAAEAAWRSLRHIAAAQDLQHARIALRDVPREAIADHLAEAAQTRDEDAPAKTRLGAILVLGGFGSSGKDLDVLARLAAAGQALGVPVIVSLEQGFFCVPPEAVAAMDNPAALLDGPAFAAWRGLHDRAESRFLFAAWNDVLLRPSSGDSPNLWGEPGAVVATQVLRSLAHSAWPSEILGSGTALGGFDVVEVKRSAGHISAIPLRALIDPGTARDLGRSGVICLVCRPDRDQVWLPSAACVHVVGANGEPAQQKAMETFHSLPFLLASRQIEDLLSRHAAILSAQPSAQQVADVISAFLTDALRTSGPGASAHVEIMPPEDGDRQDALRLEIAVQFGRLVLDGFAFSLDLVL